MIRTLTKVGIGGTYLNVIKAIYDKSIAKSTFNDEKLKSLAAKTQNKTRMLTLTTSIQHSTGSPSHSSQIGKRNKSYSNWQKRGKIAIIHK